MKKFTLIALAVLFVAVSSIAQDKVTGRPLSQKHLEAATQLAGKSVKKQPAAKSLQMQQDQERLQTTRMASAVHNKLTGKAVQTAKRQRAAQRRAAIYDQPEGTLVSYERSGRAYFPFWGSVYSTTVSGAVGSVVFGEGNKVYIKNLVSQAGAGTWVEGTLDGSTITVQLPQTAIEYPSYGYNLEVALITYDAAEQWYVKSANQTLKLNYDATTGNISYADLNNIIGLTYDDDNSWSGYADWNIQFAKVTDALVEAPADLQTELYSLTAEGYQGSLVKVGFSGDDVYVQGIDPNLPDNWVKGTVSGDQVIFKSGQYIGADEVAGYHQYLVSATKTQEYDEDYDEYYDVYSVSDADITFKYDAATKTLSESSLFLINAGKTTANYLSALENAKISKFVEVAATPATPVIGTLYEGGTTYYNYGYGWGYISFDLNTNDVDGNYILPEKLSYQLYTKVNGEVKPLNLSWWDYMYQEEETVSEIPFGYGDGWDIIAQGVEQSVYYYVVGPEAYGVQAIYRGAGEERRSEIAWAEVNGIGADIQPAAATPAYPDATIAETDNRIDYSYYTGDETLNTITNNSKPETYDVAIKLSDPALVGTLIESITFPLQEVAGVSDIKAFVTSQLRVEDGKNAADLFVKAVAPAEPGFITVTLDKPYTIPEGGVYVGYSLTVNSVDAEANQKPIAVTDKIDEGGLYLHTSDGFLKWLDVADLFGGSALIQVKVAGANVKANAVAIADGQAQYVMTGQAVTVPVTVVNHGSKGIQSFDVEYSVAGQTGTQSFTASVDALFGKSTSVELTIPAIAEKGNYDLNLKVAKVNGVDNEDAAASNTLPIIALNTVPTKRTLLEEYTGFWCGWCPRGYVALEKLAELYPDDYVLASYHNGDELEIMPSNSFPSYVSGFPAAWMDRAVSLDAYYGTSDDKEFGIVDDLSARNKQFGQADITLTPTLSDDEKSVNIESKVTFPYTVADGNFAVEYILTADGLADPTWGQSNYYAGGSQGEPLYMDTFSKTSESYVYGLPFNDVVVLTSEVLGGSEIAIKEAEADQPLAVDYKFDLADAYNTSYEPVIQDVTKLKVIALLIDATTGEVVNANKAKVTVKGTGISENSIRQDAAAATYYDLQGRRLQTLQRGLNIVKAANGDTRKVIIK